MVQQKKETQLYQRLYEKLSRYATIESSTLQALEKILHIRTIEKEAYLSKLYENRRVIGFVLDGIIRVYHLNEEGKEYNKNFFIEGDLFMTSLNENRDSAVFVQTITESNVILFDHQTFMLLAQEDEVLENIFNKILLEYLSKKQQREIELLALNAKERYALFVKNNPILSEKLPQFHIASYLGITPTQLSRVRK